MNIYVHVLHPIQFEFILLSKIQKYCTPHTYYIYIILDEFQISLSNNRNQPKSFSMKSLNCINKALAMYVL